MLDRARRGSSNVRLSPYQNHNYRCLQRDCDAPNCRICDPKGCRSDVCVKKCVGAAEHTEVVLNNVLGLNSILDKVGVAHNIVATVALV